MKTKPKAHANFIASPGDTIECDTTKGNVTVTLPAKPGLGIRITKTDPSANVVIIQGANFHVLPKRRKKKNCEVKA